jgi:hypothetical protein
MQLGDRPFAALQFGQHLRRFEAEVRQRHQASGTTGRPPRRRSSAVAVLAGHHGFGGFFADLLQDGVGALGKQRAT